MILQEVQDMGVFNNGLMSFQPSHNCHSSESWNPVGGKGVLDSRVKPENEIIKYYLLNSMETPTPLSPSG